MLIEEGFALDRFGYRTGPSGAHAARTMMLPELRSLLAIVPAGAHRADYVEAIIDRNILGKSTKNARTLSARHLLNLYGLNPEIPVFRVIRRLWDVDQTAQPLLALTIALARDPLIRLTWDLVVSRKPGQSVAREEIEEILALHCQSRLTPACIKSYAQNINGTWTQAGYLVGHVKKTRSAPVATPANFAYAAFLAHLQGYHGQRLMHSKWIRLLDRSMEEVVDLATAASRRGLIVFMNAGGISEVRFPGYLTAEEERWRYE